MTQVANLSNLYTGRSRFVSGDLVVKQDKDYENKPIPPEEQEYYFAVAVPKTSPTIGELLAQLHGLASQAYAQAPQFLAQVNLGLAATGFSWKIEDGDIAKIDPSTGAAKKIPEYIQGCYIIKFKTKYEFGACDALFNNIDRSVIKRGDYVDVMFTAAPNGRFDGNAGIILYPNAIAFLDEGDAISGTVNAAEAFKGRTMESSGQAHPSAQQTYQQTQGGGMPAATMGAQGQQQFDPNTGQPIAGNAGGMPVAGGQQQMGAGGVAQTGMGQAPQTGGMPAASSGMATTSHGDPAAMGVQPHTNILQGPQGGMVQNQGGGMPGA